MSKTVPTYELYGENTGRKPDFWLHCETIPSRSSLHHWEIRPHRHESFFQILYIDAGSGDAVFDGFAHAIVPPAVITVPPKLNHGFRFSRQFEPRSPKDAKDKCRSSLISLRFCKRSLRPS